MDGLVWCSILESEFDLNRVMPIYFDKKSWGINKPDNGGLWCCPYWGDKAKHKSEWHEFIDYARFKLNAKKMVTFKIKKDAKIFIVDDNEKARYLFEKYGYYVDINDQLGINKEFDLNSFSIFLKKQIDWNLLFKDYDAFYIDTPRFCHAFTAWDVTTLLINNKDIIDIDTIHHSVLE